MTESNKNYASESDFVVNGTSSSSSESICDGFCTESGISDEEAREETQKGESSDRDNESTDSENEKLITYQKHLEDCLHNINELDQKCLLLNETCKELQKKLDRVTNQNIAAVKEKEIMVMKYAMSEKAVLDLKSTKEVTEKKLKEAQRENQILQYKVCTTFSEKSRICQMLDNKCYELKSSQQESEKLKIDLNTLETKVKWLQNNLKNEMELRMDNEKKIEHLTTDLQDYVNQIEQTKTEAQESMNSFLRSQENRANVLDHQLKEQRANLILLRHDRDDREKQVKTLQADLEKLQTKQNETLQENNKLSVKVQQLERDRLESEQRLSELRTCADQQRQDSAELVAKTSQLEQLKFQIQNEQEQLHACNEQMILLKNRNVELESDMESCREREAELLLFTQQLTDKNVRLQSEFTAMETKVQQLSCEQTLLRRAIKEQETKVAILSKQSREEKSRHAEEVSDLTSKLGEKIKINDALTQEVIYQKGENQVIKRKLELSLKEVSKELQQCRKKVEHYEALSTSSNSSSTSLNTIDHQRPQTPSESSPDQVKVIQPEGSIDKQTLIEHIVKLQRTSARKSEKIDFLEEHINTLVAELQRKTRLLQNYMMREQTGTMTSNKMDNNKVGVLYFILNFN
ncbi:hypothetical protein FQA39_LY09729 [Lamprigera yunnana]|nr:hypothetical protein FQA39_LY09729 [Lamprigera yunnana]